MGSSVGLVVGSFEGQAEGFMDGNKVGNVVGHTLGSLSTTRKINFHTRQLSLLDFAMASALVYVKE